MSYDGPDRRQQRDDHDTVVKLLTLMTTHVKNFDEHRISFEKHVDEDKVNFKVLNKGLWCGVGAISVIELVSKFIK